MHPHLPTLARTPTPVRTLTHPDCSLLGKNLSCVLELSCVWEAESDESFEGEEDDWALRAKKAGWKWTTTIERRGAAKRFKYSGELVNALPREWHAQLATVEIGSRGLVASETRTDIHNVFRTIRCQKQAKLQAERCIAEARRRAMLGSYLIWPQRDRDDWDLHETVGAWKGKKEVENLAVADRVRQREEREKADAEGSWTDVGNMEPEQCPDSAAGKQEWEIKTAARTEISEAPEADGLICYYPDSSFRDGLSGSGFVVQHDGTEIAREKGPESSSTEKKNGWMRSIIRTTLVS